MSIGEVLAQLRAEFPDTTISKLRFLEAEGLVEPQRTPSGYRKYTPGRRGPAAVRADRAARPVPAAAGDPRAAATALDAVPTPPRRSAGAGRPSADAEAAGEPGRRAAAPRRAVLARAGIDRGRCSPTWSSTAWSPPRPGGLVRRRRAGRSPRWPAGLAEYGLEARHLRAVPGRRRPRGRSVRPAAWRRWCASSDPAARARAAETVRELTGAVAAAARRAGAGRAARRRSAADRSVTRRSGRRVRHGHATRRVYRARRVAVHVQGQAATTATRRRRCAS